MDHAKTVESEFRRQAREFSSSPDLAAPEVTKPILRAISKLESPRVLDVACGPGVLTHPLAQVAKSVIGLDLTLETLRLAEQHSSPGRPPAFVRGDAEHPPFAPASFDAAVLRLALHHVEDPVGVLRAVRELLRPEGRVVVLDVLSSNEPSIAELHNAIERLRDPSHTAMFSADELESQLERAGFDVVEQDVWQSDRAFAGWARIISEPRRMDSLEVLLRQLARAGVDAGIGLREQGEELAFTYTWALLVGTPS